MILNGREYPDDVSPASDQSLLIKQEEATGFETLPSFDYEDKNLDPGLIGSIVAGAQMIPSGMKHTMGSVTSWVGEKIAEDKTVFSGAGNITVPASEFGKTLGAKIRNFGIAVMESAKADQEEISTAAFGTQGPKGLVEKVGAGAAPGVVNLVTTIAAGVAGTAAGGPAGGALAALGTSAALFGPEKYRQLRDAGFSDEGAGWIATGLTGPIAALDVMSAGSVSFAIRPAVKAAIAKATFPGVIGRAAWEGVKAEVPTEIGQQAIEDISDFATKLKTKVNYELFEDYMVTIVLSILMGGVASTGFALNTRRKVSGMIAEAYPDKTPSEIAQMANDLTYRVLDNTVDTAIMDLGVHEEVKRVNKYIDAATSMSDVTENEGAVGVVTAEQAIDIRSIVEDTSMEDTAKIKELAGDIKELSSEIGALSQDIGTLTQDERIMKMTKRESFVEQMGREPREGELGKWTMKKIISETGKGEKALAAWDRVEGAIDTLRTVLTKKIDEQPGANKYDALLAKVEDLQSQIDEQFSSVKDSEGAKEAFDKIQSLAAEITNTEATIQTLDDKLKSVNETEAKMEALGTQSKKIQQNIADIDAKIEQLKTDPTTVFIQEMGREPKGPELQPWIDAQTAKMQAEAQALQTQIDRANQEVIALQDRADRIRSGQETVAGTVNIAVSQLRSARLREGNRIIKAFKKGGVEAVQAAKAVRRLVAQFLAQNKKMPDRLKVKAYQLLNLTTKPKEVEKHFGHAAEVLNELISQERIQGYREAVAYAINQLVKGKAGPPNIVYGKHLARVMRGKVPGDAGEFSDTQKTKAGNIEWLFDNQLAQEAGAELIARDMSANLQLWLDQERSAQVKADGYIRSLIDTVLAHLETVPGRAKTDTVEVALHPQEEKVKTGQKKATLPFNVLDIYMSMERILDSFSKGMPGVKLWQGEVLKALSPRKLERARRQKVYGQLQRLRLAYVEKFKRKAHSNIVNMRADKTIDVDITTTDAKGVVTNRTDKITKGQAMNIYLLVKQPGAKEVLIKNNGFNEKWLNNFEANPPFSKTDFTFLMDVQTMLVEYGKAIAPIFERTTGKPFIFRQEYFPFLRLMEDNASTQEELSWVQMLMDGKIDHVFDAPDFTRSRSKSELKLQVTDVFRTMEQYIYDAEHFIAFADYAKKADRVFNDVSVREAIKRKFGNDVYGVILRTVKDIISGGAERQSAIMVDKSLNRYVKDMAAVTLSPLRQLPRQIFGFAVATQKVGPIQMIKGLATLPYAIASGKIKMLTEHDYMKTRFAGAFDFYSNLAQASAEADIMGAVGGASWLSKADAALKKARANDLLWRGMRFSSRYGDRGASLIAGWASLNQSLNDPYLKMHPEVAIQKAIDVIDSTQQSMDTSALPIEFSQTGGLSPLLLLFGRFNAQYVENYAAVMSEFGRTIKREKFGTFGALKKNSGRSRVDYADVVNTVLTYHVIVPFFEAWIGSALSGDMDDFDDEWKLYSAIGPAGNLIFIGDAIKAAVAHLILLADEDAEFAQHLLQVSGGTIVDSVFKTVQKAIKTLSYAPDFTGPMEPVKAVADVATVATRLPLNVPANAAKAIEDVNSGERTVAEGLKLIAGFSEAAIDEGR